MEDIIEHLGRGLLGFFRLVVAIVWASVEWAFEKVLWLIGWPITKAFTLGAYPKEGFLESGKASIMTQFIVGLVGFLLPITAVYFLAHRFGA